MVLIHHMQPLGGRYGDIGVLTYNTTVGTFLHTTYREAKHLMETFE